MTELLSPEFMQRLAGSLLHFFWQGGVIALASAVGLRLLSRRSAETRYLLSVGALLVMFIAPIVTFVFYAETGAAALRLLKLASEVMAGPVSTSLPSASTAAWTQWIVVAWFSGVFACSVRLTAGWRLSHRLIESADPAVPKYVVEVFESVREALVQRKTVRLLLSTRIDTPAVVGWLRPVILLPVSALTGLSQEQLRSVLAHELAHIRRHDFLVNMMQRCVESVLFYHPAVWWLSSRIRAERENCCDDLAVKTCGNRLTYAEALIELERLRPDVPPLAVAATGSSLVVRVRRILGKPTASQDWQSATAALVFVLAWMIAGALEARPIPTPQQSLAAIALPAIAPTIEAPSLSSAAASLAAILTAQPVEEPAAVEPEAVEPVVQAGQALGTLEGTVTSDGRPLSNAQVTLSGGALNSGNVSKTIDNLWATAQVPPDSWDAVLRNYYTERGMTTQQANAKLNQVQITGMPPAQENGQFEDDLLSRLLSYNNTNFGISVYNSEFTSAVKAFRAGNAKYKLITDRGGRFSFRDVPAGEYTVRVERDGYFGVPGSNLVPQTGSVKVKVGGGTTAVEVPMVRGAVISGRVRDELGLPLANMQVQAFAVSYNTGIPSLRAAAINKTNDRGEYSIFWLPGGEYYVAAITASTQVVGNGGLLQQVVGTFYPGTPDVSGAVMVKVKTGGSADGIDFTHRQVRAVRVSGTVSTTIPVPDPAAGARGRGARAGGQSRQAVLLLFQHNSDTPDDVGAKQVGAVQVDNATGKGTFEFEVSPGSYDLFARMPNAGGAVNVSFGRISFDARDTEIKGLNIVIAMPPIVDGTVTVDGNAPGQTPIKVSLQVDDSGAKLPAYGITIRARTVPVNPEGAFQMPAVWVGHWQIFTEGLGPTMYIADVRQGGISVFDSGINVTGEPLNPLQVLVRKDGGTVTGQVVDNAKRPVPNALVVLVPPDNRRQNRQLYKQGTADATGRFSITGVAPGTYRVYSWPYTPPGLFATPITAAYYSPKYLARYSTLGRPVTVTAGGSTSVDITAAPLD